MKFRNSSIQDAMFCPTRFKLKHIDGIETPEKPASSLIFGTAAHLIPETYFDGGNATEAFRMFWKLVDVDAHEWDRYGYDACMEMGQEFARKWVASHAKHYEPIHVEQDMEFKIGGFELTGKPDFIGKYKGKLSIVDWKTSALQVDKRRPISDPQAWVYAHAAKEIYGLDIEQVVYAPFIKNSVSIQTPICYPVTQDKVKSTLDNLVLYMRDLSTRVEWPRNTQNCLRCPYFNTCYSGQYGE